MPKATLPGARLREAVALEISPRKPPINSHCVTTPAHIEAKRPRRAYELKDESDQKLFEISYLDPELLAAGIEASSLVRSDPPTRSLRRDRASKPEARANRA